MVAHAGMKKLHRVAVGQTFVGGLVDLAHAAASDAADDAVRAAQQRTWLYTRRHCRPDSSGGREPVSTTRVDDRSDTRLTCRQIHTFQNGADSGEISRSASAVAHRRPGRGSSDRMNRVARELSAPPFGPRAPSIVQALGALAILAALNALACGPGAGAGSDRGSLG